MISYGSVCSGIESASVAWEPVGLAPAWFSEIEPFPCAVLAHRWPGVTNHGDMLDLPGKITRGEIAAPDILVGGTPCQAFSVAGGRKGLADPRGQLTLKYVEVANAIDEQRQGRECAIVWENVPGVLHSKDNAFGCFLAALAGEGVELQPPGDKWENAGYVYGPQRSVAWRVLDAQFFGVAQRRRRVFVVASARAGFDPAAVLFERQGVRRDTKPSREEGENTTAGIRKGLKETVHRLLAFGAYKPDQVSSTVQRRDYKDVTDLITCTPIHDKATRCAGATGRGPGNGLGIAAPGAPMFTLTTGDRHSVLHGTQDPCSAVERAFAIGRNNGAENVLFPGVRRLTVVETERLQGFPDNYTRIPWRGKAAENCPDGPRYKAVGNSKAVPVVRWVGARVLRELLR